ncbi:MAG: homoserine kinase [Aigarchaeota archaeon]|nr:homoserine kinase [Candidatus Geocrenenecus dongiae]
MRVVEVSAPATIANLGPGFDIVGLAIEGFRDIVRLELREDNKIEFELVNNTGVEISEEPEKNSAVVSALKVMEYLGVRRGFRMNLTKNVPVGIGLGSSGASSAAAAYAMNTILGGKLPMELLVKLAAEGERAACGSPHLDNVAPALYGGFTMILDVEKPVIFNIKPSVDFSIVLVTPKVYLPKNKTEYARSLLPKNVSLELMTKQQASLARLIIGIMRGDLEMMGEAISRDYVVEPARSIMIPSFHKIKEHALKSGALGFSISGAGPSVFAITYPEKAENLLKEIISKFEENNVEARGIITKPSTLGAAIKNLE